MKKCLFALLLPTLALASPETRALKAKIEERIKGVSAEFKKNCGCDVTIEVDWASYEGLYSSVYPPVNTFKDHSAAACADKEAKAAICKLKSVLIKYDKDPKSQATATVANGKGTLTCTPGAYKGMSDLAKILDT